MPKTLMNVPESIDRQVAFDALAAMGIGIDRLNSKQEDYRDSW